MSRATDRDLEVRISRDQGRGIGADDVTLFRPRSGVVFGRWTLDPLSPQEGWDEVRATADALGRGEGGAGRERSLRRARG